MAGALAISDEKVDSEVDMDVISIIIPVYNVEEYLERCLQSVIEQSYRNIEILLINDGSTDGSERICLQYAAMDTRIRYYTKVNGGLSDARNYGIERASGEYLFFVDSDDYLTTDCIDTLYHALHKADADVAVGMHDKVTPDGQCIWKPSLSIDGECITGREFCRYLLQWETWFLVTAWNKLYKKAVFRDMRYAVGKLHEDEYIAFALFYDIKKIALVDAISYHYVQRQGSIMLSAKDKKRFVCCLEYQRLRMEFYERRQDAELLYAAQSMSLAYLPELADDYSRILDRQDCINLHTMYQSVFRALVNGKKLTGIKKYYYGIAYYDMSLFLLLKKGKDMLHKAWKRGK